MRVCVYLGQRLIDLHWIQTTRAQPLQPLLFLNVSAGTLHPTVCTGTDPLLQQLQLMVECFLVWLLCSLAQTRSFHFSVVISHKHSQRRKDLRSTHLDLCKEMSEAALRVDLKRRRQVQYELHDDGLVGHLFHQGMFLGMRNTQQCSSADPSSHHLLTACLRCPLFSLVSSRKPQCGTSVQNCPSISQHSHCGVCPSFEVEAAVPPLEEVACFRT